MAFFQRQRPRFNVRGRQDKKGDPSAIGAAAAASSDADVSDFKPN